MVQSGWDIACARVRACDLEAMDGAQAQAAADGEDGEEILMLEALHGSIDEMLDDLAA